MLEVHKKKRRAETVALAALAGLAMLSLGACGNANSQEPKGQQPAAEKARPALTVGVASVGDRPITKTVVGTGSVVAWQQLTIAAEIAGLRLLEVNVDEGDVVQAGQVLARLDDSILRAQLAQYEAAAAEAEANLANAQADFRRGQELAASRNISEQLFQQRQTAARTAEARLAVIRAQRDEVQARIKQTVVRAPTDGTIAKRTTLLGSVVAVGTELFRLVRDSRLELDAQVPELEIRRVAPGQAARVSHGDDVIGATVRLVSPVIDANTRLAIARVALPANSPLKIGMFARAEIETGTAEALAVPQEALVYRDGRPSAFAVASDNRVSLRPLETGVRQEGWVEVRSGLDRGERIVVAGAGFLNDGDIVRVDSAAAELKAGQ